MLSFATFPKQIPLHCIEIRSLKVNYNDMKKIGVIVHIGLHHAKELQGKCDQWQWGVIPCIASMSIPTQTRFRLLSKRYPSRRGINTLKKGVSNAPPKKLFLVQDIHARTHACTLTHIHTITNCLTNSINSSLNVCGGVTPG